jgi:hypothetical protein
MPRNQSRTQGLCRLLSAPAGNSTFPTLSLRIFPHVLGPLPRLLLWCTFPFLPTRQRPSQHYDSVGAIAFATIAYSRTAISVRNSLRGCSHSLMFRPVSLLATPIAPTAVSRCSGLFRSALGFGGYSIAFAMDLSPTPMELFTIPATLRAAVAFTSAHISVRYLPEQRIY